MNAFCTAPFVGIVVDPMLNIQMCCSDTTRHFKTNLKNVHSLRNFFYSSSQYQKLRADVNKYSLAEFKPCSNCHIAKDGFTSEMDAFNKKFPNPYPIKLRYLEVTTSNVCTQTCVMCVPLYSSALVKLRGEGQVVSMTDEDLRKIFEVLPDLETLTIKGGEPFADQKNLKILEELYKVNPTISNVTIVSNGTHIPIKFQEMLAKFKNIELSISVDGVDEVYQWHRGSPYSKTVDSLNKFYHNTSIAYSIQSVVTVYNLPSISNNAKRYFKDFIGLRNVNNSNIVMDPPYVSPRLYNDNDLFYMCGNVRFNQNIVCPEYNLGIDKIVSYSLEDLQMYHPKFKTHTDFYNKVRGFNILDYVPEAKALYDNYGYLND